MTIIHTSESSPLHIDTIHLPGGRGQIGMSFWPDRKDKCGSGNSLDRGLNADLDVISAWGAYAVVTLLEECELELFGVSTLPALLKERKIEWHHLPVRDFDVPDSDFEEKWLVSGQRLKEILVGEGKILLHCSGGIGRTGTVAARLLVEFGFKPSHAVDLVRKTRPGAIGTEAQEQYVLKLKKWPMRLPKTND